MTSDQRSPAATAADRDRLAAVLELLVHAISETIPQEQWDGALRIAYGQAHTLVFSDGAGFDPDRLRRAYDMLDLATPSRWLEE